MFFRSTSSVRVRDRTTAFACAWRFRRATGLDGGGGGKVDAAASSPADSADHWPRASRHLLLIRHGDYFDHAEKREDRKLTELGQFPAQWYRPLCSPPPRTFRRAGGTGAFAKRRAFARQARSDADVGR